MFRLLAGMALGWMAFTPEGKKMANSIAQKAMTEVNKTLKETGLIEDDKPGTESK